jgi:lysophospholipase L1-like esterase
VTPRRRARLALGAAGLLAIVAAGGCGAETDGGAEYAALGDSYSSGAGIAPVADAGCARSTADFGSLVARRMGYASFEDASCGGATTTDLRTGQVTRGADNRPQLDAVGPRTRLVTLTLGLNDRGLATKLLVPCLTAPGRAPSDACKVLLGANDADADKTYAAAADRLRTALRSIRKAAPRTRIVLVGYPRIFPDEGSCPDRVPIVEAMVPRVRRALEVVNEDWKAVAASVGADYVDTWSMSRGHDVCSADPWVNGATSAPGKAAPLHPFAAFHRAVADAIVGLLKTS